MHTLRQTLTHSRGTHGPLWVSHTQRGNQGITASVTAQMQLLPMHSVGLTLTGNRRWVAGRRAGPQQTQKLLSRPNRRMLMLLAREHPGKTRCSWA